MQPMLHPLEQEGDILPVNICVATSSCATAFIRLRVSGSR
jgi:hypothetical protein